jgi:hypothetical protein
MSKLFFTSHTDLRFYDDGTYLRHDDEMSWWMADEKGISVKHSLTGQWMQIHSKDVSSNDRIVNDDLIKAISNLVDDYLLSENRLDI